MDAARGLRLVFEDSGQQIRPFCKEVWLHSQVCGWTYPVTVNIQHVVRNYAPPRIQPVIGVLRGRRGGGIPGY